MPSMMNPASMPMMMNPAAAVASPYQPHNPATPQQFGSQPGPSGGSQVTGPTPFYREVEDHEEEDFMKSAFTKPKPSEERPGTPSSASMDKNGSAQKDGSQKDKSEASTDASGAGVRLPASLSLVSRTRACTKA
jgi:hypothetical protein